MNRPALHVHTRCATIVRDLDCTYDGKVFRVQEDDGEPVEVAVEDFLDHLTADLTGAAAAEADLAVIMSYEREWTPVLVGCRRTGAWHDLSAPDGARPVTWLDLRSHLCAIAASLIEASGRVVTSGPRRDVAEVSV